MAKTFDLVVYFVTHEDGKSVGHSIAEASSTDFDKLLEYCATFDTENYEIWFDVWTDEDGQFSINDLVRMYKEVTK